MENNKFHYYFLVALVISVMSATIAEAASIRIPNGTIVPVKLNQIVSPEIDQVGSTVQAVVAANVEIDGFVVFAAGTPVVATVEQADQAGAIGEGAKISIMLRSVYAVDGTSIPLTGSYRAVGEDKEGSTIALGVILCPLFLLREGDDVELVSGAETRAITLGDARINVNGSHHDTPQTPIGNE
jgi:hypothetical protein